MGAMQAQDYNMARWAMGIRLPGLSQAALQGSIDRGEVLRTHVMRPTWHLIAAKDVSWMLDLTAPHIKHLLTSRLRELELSPAILKKAARVFEKNLMGNHHLTRDELLLLFEKNKVPTHDQRASHIFMWAEIEKIICSGAMREKKNTYALFDERVAVNKKFTREEGLINLAMRYFTSHGPATLQDFLNWSGLPIADGRKTIEMIQDYLFFEKIDSQTFWFKDANIRPASESAYLLPAFDEFIIGYKDRSAYLSGKHKPLYMMQGLDESFDAAFFVSYHGSAGATGSVLHHTYNPRAIAEVRLNGTITGEAGINALVALACQVPVVLISGDRITIDEAQAFCPDIESVVVKDSVSHNAALSVHPERARELIHDGARRAIARLSDIRLPSITLPAELTVRFHSGAFAELACELRGVERREEKVVALRNDDPLQLYRTFIATVLLSRGVSE